MKRPWIIRFVLVVVVALMAFAITKMTTCGRSAPSLDRLQDVSFLSHELNLSEAQAKEIKQFHLTLATELNECCMKHCAARSRLAPALATESNGTAQTDAIVVEMCRVYEASERATLDHIRKVRARLNEDQKKRFDVMISNGMGQTCSMPNM